MHSACQIVENLFDLVYPFTNLLANCAVREEKNQRCKRYSYILIHNSTIQNRVYLIGNISQNAIYLLFRLMYLLDTLEL